MNSNQALLQYRNQLNLNQINFAQYANLKIDELQAIENQTTRINPKQLETIKDQLNLNLKKYHQTIKAHQTPNLNLISDQLFQIIELEYQQIFNPKINHDNQLIKTLTSIIRNDPKIYYDSFKQEAVPLPWPQAEAWKQITHQFKIQTHTSQSMQLKYGRHGSKKFGDIISIPYQKPMSKTDFKKIKICLNTFLKSHRKKQINQLATKCYLDDSINRFLIFIKNPNLTKE